MNAITHQEAQALAAGLTALDVNVRSDSVDFAEALAPSSSQEQQAQLCADFMAAFLRGDMGAAATFAGRTYLDHSRDARNPVKRHPTMGEVAYESLDYARGPEHDEVYAFLAERGAAGDAKALALIQRMGAAYAYYRVEIAA